MSYFNLLTFTSISGLISRGCRNEVELGQLHIGGNVNPPPCCPAVWHIICCVANCGYRYVRQTDMRGGYDSQDPIFRGHLCLSIEKSSRFMMQVARMVSLWEYSTRPFGNSLGYDSVICVPIKSGYWLTLQTYWVWWSCAGRTSYRCTLSKK